MISHKESDIVLDQAQICADIIFICRYNLNHIYNTISQQDTQFILVIYITYTILKEKACT